MVDYLLHNLDDLNVVESTFEMMFADMSEIDLPASMKPKLAAIETAINEAFDKMRLGGRMIVEGALEIGQQLTAAKAIIVPQECPRWCDERLPFSLRLVQEWIKMWSKYTVTSEDDRAFLIESTDTIRGAMRLLDSQTPNPKKAALCQTGQISQIPTHKPP